MNVQTSKLSPCPSFPCLLLLFSCVFLWEVSMTVFFPLTQCGFSATHLKDLKSKYQDLFSACQLWTAADTGSAYWKVCMVVDILMKMNPLNEHTNSTRMSAFIFFFLGFLIGTGHNLRNTSLIDKNKIFFFVLIWLVMLFLLRDFNFSWDFEEMIPPPIPAC